MTPHQKAQQLLSEDLVQLVADGMRLRYVAQWARETDTAARDRLWIGYNMCSDLEQEIRAIAGDT